MSADRYEIIKPLDDQGGMGITSLGYDRNLNRNVVIKRLNTDVIKDPKAIALFNNQLKEEACNQANLTHHNIAKIYDYYEIDHMGYIVMEFVDGRALSSLSQFDNVSKENLHSGLSVIKQLLEGLNSAHKHGIFHRDIKPDNIMYDSDSNIVKIIDFGLSKKSGISRPNTVFFAHTPGYTPKEVMEQRAKVRDSIDEYKRDIYSAGITIYKMLTGNLPYGHDDYRIPTPRISDFRNDINEELNELFYSMIEIDDNNRLYNLEIVIDAIERQLKHGYSPLVKMPKLLYNTRIRDAVHGYIKLTDDELKIMDNRFFQRLRNIKQLGTTYLVYPCASHTRFEHSLGVMHVATRIFNEIVEKRNNILGWDEDEILKQRQMLRLLAMLHDIGHAPFSHVGDELYSQKISNHENMAAKIIRESELSTIIDKIGTKSGGFTHLEIAGLIEGVYLYKYNLIKQIFSNSVLDADRMDYLIRDSHMAGVEYGTYDVEHIIRSMDIIFVADKPILALNIKGIYALEEFILARYYMFNQVYLHKTRRFYDKILEKCMVNFLNSQYDSPLFPEDINEYVKIDDHKVMSYIKNHSANEWNKMYLKRTHFKLIEEVFPHATAEDLLKVDRYKKAIDSSGVNKDKYIIDEFFKSPIEFTDEENNPMFGIINSNGDTSLITECSHVLENMNNATYIFRLYVDNNHITDFQNLIKEA